jgi:hypothetical protein
MTEGDSETKSGVVAATAGASTTWKAEPAADTAEFQTESEIDAEAVVLVAVVALSDRNRGTAQAGIKTEVESTAAADWFTGHGAVDWAMVGAGPEVEARVVVSMAVEALSDLIRGTARSGTESEVGSMATMTAASSDWAVGRGTVDSMGAESETESGCEAPTASTWSAEPARAADTVGNCVKSETEAGPAVSMAAALSDRIRGRTKIRARGPMASMAAASGDCLAGHGAVDSAVMAAMSETESEYARLAAGV